MGAIITDWDMEVLRTEAVCHYFSLYGADRAKSLDAAYVASHSILD